MKPIKCIVIDDEPLAIEGMCILIKKIPALELMQTFLDPEQATAFLKENLVDFIFSDIRMPRYTGVDWFKSLESKPLIIFTTAYTEYAIEGFELNAIDYLLKPISFERFYKAVMRTQEYLDLKQQQDLPEADNHIFIRCSGKFEKVVLNDILYIEGLKDYVKIVVENSKQNLITAMNVKTISEKLPPHLFIRTHRSYLVNVSKIKSVDKDSVMLPEISIPIGETYKEEVFKLVIQNKLLKRK